MGRKESFSLWVKLDRFPPVVCRLLARSRGRGGSVNALTDADLSLLSGLSVSQVASLSRLASWDDVPVKLVRQFSSACGVDFADRATMRHLTRYLAHSPSFGYLRKSAEWPKFKELMEIYALEASKQ